MSNGADVAAKESNKMTAIINKLKYVDEACKKNLNLSSEIRAKLLCTDSKEAEASKETPREGGQLNNIRDHLQDTLNVLNISNAHLVSVNKEI